MRMIIKKPITLIGMMGTGKSTIGQALAAQLSLPFYDSDRLIEDKAGRKISEIFAEDGEAAFREMERAIILPLLIGAPAVISTGGGSVTVPDIADALFTKTLVICLTAPVDILMARMEDVGARPLLAGGDARAMLQTKLEERAGVYARAHITIDTSLKPVPALVDHLTHLISLYQGQTA